MHVSSQPPMHLDAHDAGPNCMNHVYLDIILLLTILLHFTYSLRLCVLYRLCVSAPSVASM